MIQRDNLKKDEPVQTEPEVTLRNWGQAMQHNFNSTKNTVFLSHTCQSPHDHGFTWTETQVFEQESGAFRLFVIEHVYSIRICRDGPKNVYLEKLNKQYRLTSKHLPDSQH